MKKIIVSFAVFLYTVICVGQVSFNLEISGVEKHGGRLYLSLFDSEQKYKEKRVYLSLEVSSGSETLNVPLTLTCGEYFFSVFQDSNGDGKLETGIMGIPKELVGLSNYDGKGVPGNFNRHKVLINEKTKRIVIHLYKI